MKDKRRLISVIVLNEHGVLSRIVGLFSGRGYNIDSLTVAPVPNTEFSRVSIVTSGDGKAFEQIVKQLYKLIPIYKVIEEGEFVGQVDAMPNYGSRILEFFANGRPSFTAIFTEVLMGFNFAIIASAIAFIIGFAPGPIGIILYAIFSSLIGNHTSASNPIYLLIGFIVFILAVVFRHLVILKFDPKK